MNGPEHYKEAEQLLAKTRRDPARGASATVGPSPQDIAAAQVHATLALAAATAGHRTTWTQPDYTATYVDGDWAEVL